MSNDSEKIIYSMYKVTKRHGQREVLKSISLSYFYGAKIGVLGLNGSGKSSLLRVLAGVDKNFEGETHVKEGYTVGYLEQEPLVDETRTVREVVEEGVGEIMAIVREYNEINEKFAEPMEADEMDALIERQGKVQELMDAKGAWDIDSKLDMAMDSLRCPPSDTLVSVISGGERRR
ncbi:MAG: ATP-binding cassette domain-containing protein, partial [Proteobacteria bacterium]|nr:ATP-binding cassette domain-containing protein [Pseudomonadota bacterium]